MTIYWYTVNIFVSAQYSDPDLGKKQISDPFFVSEQQLRCAKNSNYFKRNNTGVNYTSGKFATGINEGNGANFATVNDTGGKKWEQYQKY